MNAMYTVEYRLFHNGYLVFLLISGCLEGWERQ